MRGAPGGSRVGRAFGRRGGTMSRGARRILVAILLLGSAGVACESERVPEGAARETGFPLTLSDDEGVEVTLDAEPRRIVTFAPSHTEILFSLGLEDRLVGVSGRFDDHPPEARDIVSVGGAGGVEPNIEKVVSLEPDLLLTAFIGGEWKERLRDLDIPVFTTLASGLDDTLDDIEMIGRLTGAPDEAQLLTQRMAVEIESVRQELVDRPRVSCFLDFTDLYTVGPGSLEFDLLQRAGCDPVTGGSDEPYPQWSVEQIVRDDPDVYLISEGQTVEGVRSSPGIRDLTAVKQGRVFPVDGDLISRPGPRVVQGIRVLAAALHGD